MNGPTPFDDLPEDGAQDAPTHDDVFDVQAKVDLLRKNFGGQQGRGQQPGSAMLMTKTAHSGSMTVLKPRDIVQVRDLCIREAEVAGAEFFYRWEVTDKKTGEVSEVKGLSVQGAMCVARYWGNCDVDGHLEQENAEAWYYSGVFIDKETNFTVRRPFRMSKSAAMFGNMDAERKDIARFNKGSSMAMRNAIEDGVPSWLTKEVVESAQRAAIGDVEQALRNKFHGRVELFAHWLWRVKLQPWGVTPQALLHKFNRISLKAFSVYDLVKMKLDAIALESETTTAAQLYPAAPGQQPAEGKHPQRPTGQQQAPQGAGEAHGDGHATQDELDAFGKGPEAKGNGRAAEIVGDLSRKGAEPSGKAASSPQGTQEAPKTDSAAVEPSGTSGGATGAAAKPAGASGKPDGADEYRRLLKAAKGAKDADGLRLVHAAVLEAEAIPEKDMATLRAALDRKAKELGAELADHPDEDQDDEQGE